jgi:hypothetical protein
LVFLVTRFPFFLVGFSFSLSLGSDKEKPPTRKKEAKTSDEKGFRIHCPFPFVAFLWDNLNRLLRFEAQRIAETKGKGRIRKHNFHIPQPPLFYLLIVDNQRFAIKKGLWDVFESCENEKVTAWRRIKKPLFASATLDLHFPRRGSFFIFFLFKRHSFTSKPKKICEKKKKKTHDEAFIFRVALRYRGQQKNSYSPPFLGEEPFAITPITKENEGKSRCAFIGRLSISRNGDPIKAQRDSSKPVTNTHTPRKQIFQRRSAEICVACACS